MLVYLLTGLAVVALIGTHQVRKAFDPSSRGRLVCAQLRSFFEAFFVAGLLFSVIQFALSLSNDYEATSTTIAEIESHLGKYRAVSALLTLSSRHQILLYTVLAVLFLLPFGASRRSIGSSRRRRSAIPANLYVVLTLITSLILLGSMTAHGALAPRVATLERHLQRIEERYGEILEEASRQLDRSLTSAAIEVLKQDDQWIAIHSIWLDLVKNLNQLPAAFPDLFTAARDSRPAGTKAPLASLVLLPAHVVPLVTAPDERSAVPTLAEQTVSILMFGRRFGDGSSNALQTAPFEISSPVRWQFLNEAITSTYWGWSEDGAARLQQEVAQGLSESAKTDNGYVIEALTARVIGALYEAPSQPAVAMAPQDEWAGLPSQFLKTFLDTVLNEEAKNHIAIFANQRLAEWVEGQRNWEEMTSGYAGDVRAELNMRSPPGFQNTQRVFRATVRQAAAEYALVRNRFADDVRRYAVAVFEKRWRGFEQAWLSGVSRLTPSARESSMKVLARIRDKLHMQHDPISRIAQLGKIEDAWRGVLASPHGEGEAALAVAAPAIIVSESVALGSRQFASENQEAILNVIVAAVQERFRKNQGRPPKMSEVFKLDSEVRAMFADSAKLTAAAAGRLSQNDLKQNAERWIPGWQACIIQGTLSTTTYAEGYPVARARSAVSMPCW